VTYIPRKIEKSLRHQLKRKKSVLLLGPRQTGKTTLLRRMSADVEIPLVVPATRQRYEQNPGLLLKELEAVRRKKRKRLAVFIDEIQKVPGLLDVVQHAIDDKLATFLLTGSSARKLRRGKNVNLLPGRVASLRLDPLLFCEYPRRDLERILVDGSLPSIVGVDTRKDIELDLRSYVETYLEEEVRAEAIVRQVGTFGRFLEMAAIDSGKIANFSAISKQVGVSHTTVKGYYQILEDCLVAHRIDPLTKGSRRKKLTRSSRYLIFDLGVRRLAAREGHRPHRDHLGFLFEQYVGLELVRLSRLAAEPTRVHFWRDPDGPEVDWVLVQGDRFVPVEVKYTESPGSRDTRHLKVFLDEYPQAGQGFIVCRTPRTLQLENHIQAISWQELEKLLKTGA